MPYVNIPPSFLVGAIAKITGKIEGEITGAILSKANDLQSKIQSEGCPRDLQRLQSKVNGLNKMIGSIDGRLAKFKALPKKLKAPVNGLKTALKIILSIPIPQAVPPGIGLPINITTKFADTLHLIKEFIRQISDDIDGLTVVTSNSTLQLKSISRILTKLQTTTKICILERELEKLQTSGELTFEDMVRLGLISDEGDLITANLRRRAIDFDSYSNLSINQIADKTGLSSNDVLKELVESNGKTLAENRQGVNNAQGTVTQSFAVTAATVNGDFDDLQNTFRNLLTSLSKSNVSDDIKDNLKDVLDTFVDKNDDDKNTDENFSHTGPNGIIYKLDIIKDPQSPAIAPRRFAVALDDEGVIVLRGPKSFSSSVDILLDEIKFRIDNQLP